MSDFKDYHKMKNNIYNLTDDVIKKLYFEATKLIDGGNGVGYYLHLPITTEDHLNNNYLAESCVNIVNEYLYLKLKYLQKI